jgi:hypothetical protein
MMPLKPFEILVGSRGEGVGKRSGDPVIARDRKGKTLPLIPLMTLIYTDLNGAGSSAARSPESP